MAVFFFMNQYPPHPLFQCPSNYQPPMPLMDDGLVLFPLSYMALTYFPQQLSASQRVYILLCPVQETILFCY